MRKKEERSVIIVFITRVINKGGKAFLALPAILNAAQLGGFSLFDLDNIGGEDKLSNERSGWDNPKWTNDEN